jgi:hypothetical protein
MLSRLLYNTYRYYAQFARPVGEAVASLREPIARQLSEHVQLAKWEDHSYFALKVSSERNGKTLRKFAAQFAAALCQPAINVLKVGLCSAACVSVTERVCVCVCVVAHWYSPPLFLGVLDVVDSRRWGGVKNSQQFATWRQFLWRPTLGVRAPSTAMRLSSLTVHRCWCLLVCMFAR